VKLSVQQRDFFALKVAAYLWQPMGKSMAETAADVLVERILSWGVNTIFGLPGDKLSETI